MRVCCSPIVCTLRVMLAVLGTTSTPVTNATTNVDGSIDYGLALAVVVADTFSYDFNVTRLVLQVVR